MTPGPGCAPFAVWGRFVFHPVVNFVDSVKTNGFKIAAEHDDLSQ
jgi:hypothetical protein